MSPVRLSWAAWAETALLLTLLHASSAAARTIYVDGKLSGECKGTYSVAARDAAGKDGDAYPTLAQAAAVAGAGDTVLIRGGTYNSARNKTENDILRPRQSGTAEQPIVFRAFKDEQVVLGDKGAGYPDDNEPAIGRGTITLVGVQHIRIEGLTVRNVEGWVFVRKASHITLERCVFRDGLNAGKGCVKLIECEHCRIENCTLENSAFDCLILAKSDYNVVQSNLFNCAAHALLAIRGGSHNVIRANRMRNPYFVKTRAEKLVEVYDLKPDRSDPNNPSHMPEAAYDSAQYNLFEHNFFGYHPFRPSIPAQPSAMQYSGQHGIIRHNLFCNPPLDQPDPANPTAMAGGLGIAMRWGGSWEGWTKAKGTGGKMMWVGEGHEAGYVTHNRVFNNTFYGYDNGCVTIPSDSSVDKMMNPPPLRHTNPSPQFSKKFEFVDNVFLNNIFAPGVYQAHTTWAYQQTIDGNPIAVVALGLLNAVRFERNDFFSAGPASNQLIYVGEAKRVPAAAPARWEAKYPQTFTGNLQSDPAFADPAARDFRLKKESALIDAGHCLTKTVSDGAQSLTLAVADAGFFYDGFGIAGEQGDLIQLEGAAATARIVRIDYGKRVLTLDRPLTWRAGQGVSLPFTGRAPDIGAFEFGTTGGIASPPEP